jgi:asparagine synthase (glutamine-hydrolysing)
VSVQFGKCNFDNEPVEPRGLEQVRPLLTPYGPDAEGSFCKGNIGVLYRAFHTNKESREETQPFISASDAIVTWDGRLDNRKELVHRLRGGLLAGAPDVAIVAAAYDRWGTDCFANLVGDWAVSVWDPKDRFLLLAKDFVGTRHLYYCVEGNRVTWCTVLDPLVLLAGRLFSVEEQYIAGWLSSFPATDLTPYVGIHSVPPCSFVCLESEKRTRRTYWNFDPARRIRYRTDAEYEEHFRAVFSESVRRRLRCDHPVLAELSGGMDSSSIVCMADEVIIRGQAETPRLDTVSYYDDNEPNWNERPYFTKVEEQRGRAGCNIDVSPHESFAFELESNRFAATPGSGSRTTEAGRQLAAFMASNANRIVLSGVGGDEVLGGVPTPVPELADLLARGRFSALAHQLKIWSLNKRKPWFHLLFEVVREFLPSTLVDVPKHMRPAPWLDANFVRRHRYAATGYESRLKLCCPLPSFQQNRNTLDILRRQLGCESLSSDPPYEKRYPYLDRDLLEFVYAIPREQLVRPGQRRSLMRRALVGIVPDEISNRKRKGYVARAPLAAISAEWATLSDMAHHLVSSALGIVNAELFHDGLQRALDGQQVPIITLMRTVGIECWLRNLGNRGILLGVPSIVTQDVPSFGAQTVLADQL